MGGTPELTARSARSRPIEPLPVITVTRDGALYLNEKPVSINVLADELKRDFPRASEVYVKPDRMTVWEPVSQALGRIECGQASNSGKIPTRTWPSEPATRGSEVAITGRGNCKPHNCTSQDSVRLERIRSWLDHIRRSGN